MKDTTKLLFLGILTLVFGIVVLGNAAIASVAIVTMAGIMLVLGGGLQLALGFWAEETANKIFTWVLGALTLFLGWSFLAHPLAGIVSLTTVLLILFAASGLMQILFAFRIKGTQYFWMMLISGAVSLVLAILLLSSAEATMKLLGVLLGFQMLSGGMSFIVMGLQLRRADF